MKSSLGEMRVAVVSRVNVQVQFGGKATGILYQDGVESIRHQNSNRSGLRSTFPFYRRSNQLFIVTLRTYGTRRRSGDAALLPLTAKSTNQNALKQKRSVCAGVGGLAKCPSLRRSRNAHGFD